MNLREAAEMALDALEIYGAQAPAVKETIEALRQALAEGVKQEIKLYDEVENPNWPFTNTENNDG